jgi:hypothetical protein
MQAQRSHVESESPHTSASASPPHGEAANHPAALSVQAAHAGPDSIHLARVHAPLPSALSMPVVATPPSRIALPVSNELPAPASTATALSTMQAQPLPATAASTGVHRSMGAASNAGTARPHGAATATPPRAFHAASDLTLMKPVSTSAPQPSAQRSFAPASTPITIAHEPEGQVVPASAEEAPAAATAGRPGSTGGAREAAIDMDQLVERALRALMSRLDLERERRGYARWS